MPWLTTYLADALERWSDRDRYGWGAFAARNVRLENRLQPQRQTEYLDIIREPFDRETWLERHREYDLLHVAATASVARRVLAKKDRSSWPSPFRWYPDALSLGPDVGLVHVVSAYSLSASVPGADPAHVIDAIDDDDQPFLEDVLDGWWRSGSRSIFAALASDVSMVVDAAMRNDPSWTEDARDRLGLAHFEPIRDPVAVVLLGYRVRDLPRAEGLRDKRPVVAPTAIDSSLNRAFCPVRQSGKAGRSVDLAARCDTPVREVLHPRPLLAPQHIIGHGQIKSGIADLVTARWSHLEWIREKLGPDDFASETDSDLAA